MITGANRPQLSILIPSIPSRFLMATRAYNRLLELIGDKNIEILLLSDNKKRSIGYKREALKNISHGKYFMFVDDDDQLLSIEEIYEATFTDVDVIDFKVRCYNNDGSEYIVTQRIGNEVEHTNDGKGNYLDLNRPPFHICAWNRKFKKYSYPDISYSEDWEWLKQCYPTANTEYFIDKVLFSYNFSPETTEASTESNEFWKNPNHESNSKL